MTAFSPTASATWQALSRLTHPPHLRELLSDPARTGFRADGAGWHLDYAKERVTPEILEGLLQLAREAGVEARRGAMYRGEVVNPTERRAALHVALRAPKGSVIRVNGENVVPGVHAVLERMEAFAEGVRGGELRGVGGERFTDVLSIGIGGSDLGPRLVCEALEGYRDGPRVRFLANVDPAALREALADLDPARTLVLVVSKTFTTRETMTNAASVRGWLTAALGEAAVGAHFAAVSTALAEVESFGISPQRTFGFWDWVGGRYSVCSAVGLSVMLALGAERFRAFREGMFDADEHFRFSPLIVNLPVLMALLGVWNRNFLGSGSWAVLPYAEELRLLPAYLQQLDMESNGKGVNLDGGALTCPASPVVWGQAGTNGQHAFYQQLHQGLETVPAQFVAFARPTDGGAAATEHHRQLLANALAQAAALALGKTEEELRAEGVEEALIPHRRFPGNRPSSTLLAERLTPRSLGALLALHEHRVFTQGVLWGVNSFDQWGVELGKTMAADLERALAGEAVTLDPATAALLREVRGLGG